MLIKRTPPPTPGPSTHSVKKLKGKVRMQAIPLQLMFPDLFVNRYSSNERDLDLNRRKWVLKHAIDIRSRKLKVAELETISIDKAKGGWLSSSIEWRSRGANNLDRDRSIPELEWIYDTRPLEFWVTRRTASSSVIGTIIDRIVMPIMKCIGPIMILVGAIEILNGDYTGVSTIVMWTWNVHVLWKPAPT